MVFWGFLEGLELRLNLHFVKKYKQFFKIADRFLTLSWSGFRKAFIPDSPTSFSDVCSFPKIKASYGTEIACPD